MEVVPEPGTVSCKRELILLPKKELYMEMKNIKIGVIADDFTGAGDAASFLEKSGAETIMYNAVPNELQVCDAAVIALKTRSVSDRKSVV